MTSIFIEKCEFLSRLLVNLNYAGINLTGYHPPWLTPRPLIFSMQNSSPRVEKMKQKIPTPEHNLPSLNAKRSMKKEHNFIKAVSFQIFHNFP